MSEVKIVTANLERAELTIPAFGSNPPTILEVSKIRDGEKRLHEAQVVTPATYAELEYTYGEGYREARRHLSLIGYQITQAEKAKREAKSRALLDDYPAFLKERGIKDSAGIRDAYLERVPEYTAAQDRIDMLKAMESLMDGKIKTFENVCRYMRKEMDLLIRTGSAVDPNKYVR